MKFTLVLTAKESHADKYEDSFLLKFDAPERAAQDGFAGRDAFAHLQLRLTPDGGHALAPVEKRHAVGVVPHLASEGPDAQPEVFIEGREYIVTIERSPTTAFGRAARTIRGGR